MWCGTTWCSALFAPTMSIRLEWPKSPCFVNLAAALMENRLWAMLCPKRRLKLLRRKRKLKNRILNTGGLRLPSFLFEDRHISQEPTLVIVRKRVAGLSEVALARFVTRVGRAAHLRGAVSVLLTSNHEL